MDLRRIPVITRRHMEAIARGPRERFEREVTVRVRRFFPHLVGTMADGELGRLVRSAAADASRLGVSAACDLARHVYLTVVLGPGFQERFAWAGRIMNSGGPPALRHRRLYCEAVDRLQRGLDPRAPEPAAEFEEGPDDDGQ